MSNNHYQVISNERMERLDKWNLSHSLLLNPQYWHDISQRYMEAAVIFLNHEMYEQCQSVAEMAVNAMLKAFYLKIKGVLPESPQTPNVWISYAHLLSEVNVDMGLLIGVLRLQYHSFNIEMMYGSSEEQARALMVQSDFFLYQLSPSVVDDNSTPYRSVL